MMLVKTPVHTAEELEHVIRTIFSKVLAGPGYSETHADMVLWLRSRYPELPPESEGERAHAFNRSLMNVCQEEFESLIYSDSWRLFPNAWAQTINREKEMSSPDEFRLVGKLKAKVLAFVKFIGDLYLRHLLNAKVIGQVVHELTRSKDTPIEEHHIECVCELLKAIGLALDNTRTGKLLLTQFLHRLVDLKENADQNTGKSVFSERIRFQIQDVVDLKGRNWQKKIFKRRNRRSQDVGQI